MNIKQKYGVDNLYFYKLIELPATEGGILYACSSYNLDKDVGVVREQKNGTWTQQVLRGDELEIALEDLYQNHGQMYFLDTKTHYESLKLMIKDFYMMLSIRRAVYKDTKIVLKD